METWLAVAALLAAAPSDAARLQNAIRDYQNFDSEKASAEFERLLGAKSPRNVRAQAHLYLGLIAFDARQTDKALSEFTAALREDPGVEPPRFSSPKVQLAFSQARESLASQVNRSVARTPPPAPPEAVVAVPSTPPPEPESHSHVATWVLAGAAAIATGVAIYGGVQVASFNATVGGANNHTQALSGTAYSASRTTAQAWDVAWISAAAVGAGCVAGAVVVW